jgi:hypothetical protein
MRSHISHVSFNSPSGAAEIISEELSETRRGVPGDGERDSEVDEETIADGDVVGLGLSTDGL